MREGWPLAALDDIAWIQQGRTLATSALRGGEHPVYGANGVIGWHDSGHYPHHVVALGCRGSCGTVHLAPPGAWLANNVMALWAKSADELDVRYLALTLQSAELIGTGVITGQVQPQITRAGLAPLRIPLPPVTEQRRIVDLIEAVDASTGSSRAAAAAAEDLWHSFASVQWSGADRLVRLDGLGEVVTGATPSTSRPEYWLPAEVPFFTPVDFDGGPALATAGRHVSMEGAQAVRRLHAPALAQVCIGATVGKVGVLRVDGCTNQQINAVVGLDEVDAYAAAALLASPEGQALIRSVAGQTTLPIVTKGVWRKIAIPWPERSIRERLAGLVVAADEVARAARSIAFALEHVRTAIANELLAGERLLPASYDRLLDGAG